jgi:hypothetical protein
MDVEKDSGVHSDNIRLVEAVTTAVDRSFAIEYLVARVEAQSAAAGLAATMLL